MAILGGVGNPVGGSFTGPAEALEVIGDFAYAYSGVVAVGSAGSGVPSTLLEFKSGNFLFVGRFQWYRGISSNTGHDYLHVVKFNGTEVLQVEDTASTDYEQESAHLIIPSYTEIIATSQNQTTGADNNIIFTLTGRIYRD